jgi:hypothetical protein
MPERPGQSFSRRHRPPHCQPSGGSTRRSFVRRLFTAGLNSVTLTQHKSAPDSLLYSALCGNGCAAQPAEPRRIDRRASQDRRRSCGGPRPKPLTSRGDAYANPAIRLLHELIATLMLIMAEGGYEEAGGLRRAGAQKRMG